MKCLTFVCGLWALIFQFLPQNRAGTAWSYKTKSLHVPKLLWKEGRGCCQNKSCSSIPKAISVGPTGIVWERWRPDRLFCGGSPLLSIVICCGFLLCSHITEYSCWLCSPVPARYRINGPRLSMCTILCFAIRYLQIVMEKNVRTKLCLWSELHVPWELRTSLWYCFSLYAISTKVQETWDYDDLRVLVSELHESGSRNSTCR